MKYLIYLVRISIAACALGLAPSFAIANDGASDQIFSPVAQPLPLASSAGSLSAHVTRAAVQALVAQGAQIEQISEPEAIRRAASHGVALEPRASDDPNYGHPWAIVKAGFGINSEINAMVEIYVNDNWTIDPHLNAGLNYSATLLGVGWRPGALCWGCRGHVGFSVGFGAEGGYRDDTDDTNDSRTGIMIATSVDAEAILRPARHFMFTAGLRLSGGAFFESPVTSTIGGGPPITGLVAGPSGEPISPPTSPPSGGTQVETSPARVVGTVDALVYIGFGF